MPYRPHGRARVNPHLGPWKVCQRCGFWYSASDIVWQYDFRGGTVPVNTRIQVCTRTCLDDLSYVNMLQILPPDPPPQFNLLPEPFLVDETNFWETQDGEDIFETQDGDDLIADIPNPDQEANTCDLGSQLTDDSAGGFTVAYLDLFNGDPSDGGVSILEDVTGSATRTNIYADLGITIFPDGVSAYVNPSDIVITTSSEATINVTHVGLYSAATSGTLLASGRVEAALTQNYPTIVLGAAVQFPSLALIVVGAAVSPEQEMFWGGYELQWDILNLVWG